VTVASDVIRDAMATNFFGALWTARSWMPGMSQRGYGRIVNVTSGYHPAGCSGADAKSPGDTTVEIMARESDS
jgi:NAD(P)-dependent dehydrogenase (short-subunit alcohol dehydrogenase family)